MKHFTFKQVIARSNYFYSNKDARSMCVKPATCGIGEFITIGNRNPVTVVLFVSPELPEDIMLHEVFDLHHHENSDGSMIQYNKSLGGYIYTWLKF